VRFDKSRRGSGRQQRGSRSAPVRDRDGIEFTEGDGAKVRGVLEAQHSLDFRDSVDRHPFGVAVLGGTGTKRLAEVWGFRFGDIRTANPDLRRIAVYDAEDQRWSDESLRMWPGQRSSRFQVRASKSCLHCCAPRSSGPLSLRAEERQQRIRVGRFRLRQPSRAPHLDLARGALRPLLFWESEPNFSGQDEFAL
jgi:hypothetical protein